MSAALPPTPFQYDLATTEVACGPHRFRITHIADMDKAIDDLFQHLESQGIPEILDELCPYFGMIWPAGTTLASHLAGMALAGRRFLEVGCGLAIPSFVAARAGALVTASDMHPDVPRFLSRNLSDNGISFRFAPFDWAKDDDDAETFDVIAASDVLYDRTFASSLSGFLARRLAPGGEALVADPCRPYFKDFIEAMQARGFQAELAREWRPPGEPTAVPVRIQRFWR